MYNIGLKKRDPKEGEPEKRIILCLFVLDGLDTVPEMPGRRVEQEIVKMVSDHIVRRFEPVGGQIICKNSKALVVLLPDSDLDHAAFLIEGFKIEIHRNGVVIMDECSRMKPGVKFNWSISVALVEYKPRDDIDPILVSLRSETLTIARFSLEARRQ